MEIATQAKGAGRGGRPELPRYALAMLAGCVWALAYPQPGWAVLGWVVPMLLLASAAGERGGPAWRRGYAGGLIFHLGALRWMLHIPFPSGAAAGWIALSAFMAIYPALWVWLSWEGFGWACGPARARFPDLAIGGNPVFDSLCHCADEMVRMKPIRLTGWILGTAVLWVGLERLEGWFLSGFPWLELGVTQYRFLPLIQIASWVGVYGVSFLVAWVSVGLGAGAMGLALYPRCWRRWLLSAGLPLAVVAVATGWGKHRLARRSIPHRELKIALVQPSIPQTLIWDPSQNTNRFRRVLALSKKALETHPDLLVWPEAAMPNLDPASYGELTRMIRKYRVWMVFGADDVEPARLDQPLEEAPAYNAAFLMNPRGKVVDLYRKQHLVIFGEYIPLARWLPFTKYLTPIQGSFSEGKGPVLFHMDHPRAVFSVLICFEDVFPDLAWRASRLGADFLLNLTNDGWFGDSSAQWQHAANAVFRAVENGVPLVRCTNNGLSCWVGAMGRLHAVHFPGFRNIYQAGIKSIRVPLPETMGPRAPATLFARWGDWFSWSCLAVAGLTTLAGIIPRRNRR